MKKFFTSLREHATNVIDLEKKNMLPCYKRTTKITSRRKSLSHLWKKIPKKVY